MSIFRQKTLACASALTVALISSACGNSNASTAAAPEQTKKTSSPATDTAATKHKTSATPSGAHADIAKALQANLDKAGIKATVNSVSPIAMPDMYLAIIDKMPPVITDKTGSYLLQGTLISLAGDKPVNLSDEAMAIVAKESLSKVDKSEMIIFSPKGTPKASVYVFSDPTCHYCQLLHKDIDQINALGIEVRYLAWPRGKELVPLSESVWCNADRNQAITDAKAGKMPKPATCDNPVQKHMELGFHLGVSGTPAVFTTGGVNIGGYLPPNELAAAAISNQ